MDTSSDSLSDAESNSSWIVVTGGMCDDREYKTKLVLNQEQEPGHLEGLCENDLGPAGSGHESDTSDGISIISEFDSDHERNVQNEQVPIREDTDEEGCEEIEEIIEYSKDITHEESDKSNVETIQSDIVEGRSTKPMKIPHFLTISIFGAVFAVGLFVILQLLNSHTVIKDTGSNECVQNHRDITLPKDTPNKIVQENFDIVEYCAVKHENDDLFQEYNEKKCIQTYSKLLKKKVSNINQRRKMKKAFKNENRYVEQHENQIVKKDVSDKTHPNEHTDGNRRNNTISGEWYHNLHDERSKIRKKERLSDWIFDRAEMRNRRRDKAQWYFQWMTGREQYRYKRGDRFSAD